MAMSALLIGDCAHLMMIKDACRQKHHGMSGNYRPFIILSFICSKLFLLHNHCSRGS